MLFRRRSAWPGGHHQGARNAKIRAGGVASPPSTVLVREHRVDPFALQRLLGHASVATTQLYTAPDQVDLEDAVNRLVAVEEPRGRPPN